MPAAFALIANRPAPQRQGRATPWIVLASTIAHLLVLGGLVAGVRVMPQWVEPPVLSVELLRPVRPDPPATSPVRSRPATRTAPIAAPPVAPVAPGVAAPTAPQTSAIAPPGFRAQGLTGGGQALRETTRAGLGCRNADGLALTKAEQTVCDETLGEKNKNRPAMYAAIDPAKKAAFDGDCRKDDDWCLYRTGKGPYPGLLGLGRKKKIKNWD
ncbi:hypothetical protein ACN2C7_01925 [Caulobacter sp. ErkDOM-E]|uniref:hypothetical protein n=1 Tax=Caulobacter sp. ErkDOM-E TaxID=3402778 RepID=UPI003AF5AE8E